MRSVLCRTALATCLFLPSLLSLACGHEPTSNTDFAALFTNTDVMIPPRYAVKRHTEIYTPKDAKEPLPFFLTRTPYGLHDNDKGFTPLLALYQEMFADGYIFVFQDI